VPVLTISWPVSLGSKSDDIVAEVGAAGALQGSANQRRVEPGAGHHIFILIMKITQTNYAKQELAGHHILQLLQ